MVDFKQFLAAIDDFENYGIAKEVTIQALKEAFCSLFVKKNYEDTRVDVNIDVENKDIQIHIIKTVVDDDREDDLDDNLEMTLSEALELNPEAKVGDDIFIKKELDNISKGDALRFKSVFKQKIKEAEKQAVYEAFQDKKGELITGVVEKIEPNFTIINIGRTTVNLYNNRKIGDETFSIGEHVKVYLSEINGNNGGPQLMVTRAEGGFLKRLFEEEVHEVYDGTVVIKDVARKAGERSKISVYSTSENVDPIGACIGPAGSKIQKICAQLGKEKIDVVEYHECPGLFIAEALKPADVIGVSVDEESHSAIAVVANDGLRVAIGKKGINVVLAVKLTGWKIDIKEMDTALGEGISFKTLEQLREEDRILTAQKLREELLRVNEEEHGELYDEPETTTDETSESEVTEIEIPTVEETPAVEETKEEEPVVEEEVEEEIPFEDQKVEVNLTQPRVSLAELEKEIEEDKKKKQVQPKKKFVKKEEEPKEEPKVEEEKESYTAMPIYSQEELDEFDEEEPEENSYDDEDIDYSEYDSYYEE